MGKSQRTKGSTYENEVCKAIFPFWPSAKRNLAQYQGSDGRDLDGTEPICFQLKRRRKIMLHEIKTAYIEAQESTSNGYPIAAAVWRDDRDASYVMLNLDDFVKLLCGVEDRVL
jgi:hypothetical protein